MSAHDASGEAAMSAERVFGQPLAEFLGSGSLAGVLIAAAEAGRDVGRRIAAGPLSGNHAEIVGANSGGEAQKALDIHADERFEQAFRSASVRALASEERDEPEILDPHGEFLVAIDPLDGSSNIGVNVTMGSILAIFAAPARAGIEPRDLLLPGHAQRAAVLIVYGPHLDFVFTVGAGTHAATLDPDSGVFRMTRFDMAIPEGKAEFAINASNARHWPDPVRAYIEDCVMGESGPRTKNFNMRWIGALAAEANRILISGGVYLYPDDARTGHGQGRLRLVYEGNPIAFLVEQAGGLATDGINRILDIAPKDLHQRVPLIFGSTEKVERVRRYFVDVHRIAARAPLFGRRGLLR
jgi:fructose-1,6-bisphosphatase I